MCGIFGFLSKSVEMDGYLLRSATRNLRHRGPDAEGAVGWTEKRAFLKEDDLKEEPLRIGLGHCRLSILDLSNAGRQPMEGPGGTWIVFNGEIYNYRELKKELERLGYTFFSGTDTEVILHAYTEWGSSCVSRFNGMWAFVLYDPSKKVLFASRDRLGVKPFYYIFHKDKFIFSSEIKSILMCPGFEPIIDIESLAQRLIYGRMENDSHRTIYRDIVELRGGTSMEVDVEAFKIKIIPFWEPPDVPDLDLNDQEALDQFSELIEDSVRLRLHADVPVAITLSGGVDSSVVTVAASRVAKGALQTFTSRFPDFPEIDESAYARMLTEAVGIQPAFVEPVFNEMEKDIPRLFYHQEMPFHSLSVYVLWVILKNIKARGYPVVLSGQGGDELFLGYERYYVNALLAKYPNIIEMVWDLFAASRHSALSVPRLILYCLYFSFPHVRHRVALSRKGKIYRQDFISGFSAHHSMAGAGKNIRKLQASELRSTLSSLLRYDDRTAGAHGMETRLPFLDYRIVEFAYRLPLKHKIRNGWTKYLLRCYLDRHGHKQIAWRKHKLGFNAPQSDWVKRLIGARKELRMENPFIQRLLREKTSLQNMETSTAWDIYSIMKLSEMWHWRLNS